ncbi:hypothetical protein CHUAL_003628 [Chamberlinius hualienensis]
MKSPTRNPIQLIGIVTVIVITTSINGPKSIDAKTTVTAASRSRTTTSNSNWTDTERTSTIISSNLISKLTTDKPIDSGNVTNNPTKINHGSSPTSFKYNNATLKPIHVVAGEDIILECIPQRKSMHCQWFRNERIVAMKDRYSFINHTYLNDSLSGTNTTFCSIRIKNITTAIDGHNWRCETTIDDYSITDNNEVVIEYQLVYQLKSSNENSTSLTANNTDTSLTSLIIIDALLVVVAVMLSFLLMFYVVKRCQAKAKKTGTATIDVSKIENS